MIVALGASGARAQEVDEEEVAPTRTATPTPVLAHETALDLADADGSRPIPEAPEPVAQTATAAPTVELPGGIRASIHGFIHADAVVWDESSADALDPSTRAPLNDTRVLIRRARVRLELERDLFSGHLELDANTVAGPVARLLAATISARWPGPTDAPPLLAATLGLLKVPFGAATPEEVDTRLYLESPTFVRAYYPGEYDLGLVLHGGWSFLRYSVAAMNGDPVGEASVGGQDLTATKDLLGRVGVDASPHPRVRIQAGSSALVGEGLHPGTPTTKDELVWRDVNENGLVELTEIQVIAGAAATPPESFERFALGADARVVVDVPGLGEWALFGELVWAGNLDRGVQVADPIAAGRDLRELGWSVGAAFDLGPWARLGVRYDAYDPDADAADAQGGVRVPIDAAVRTLSVVGQWRPAAYGHVTVAYDHEDNARGRAADGTPARLPNDRLTIRVGLGI